MKLGRFFSLLIASGMAIAGGLFVSDQRVVETVAVEPKPIRTGEPLRLGVMVSQTPTSAEMHQALINALFLAQEQVNRCGGINQAPVFLAVETPTVHHATEALVQEARAMKHLIRTEDVHGAIAVFTPESDSHGLDSEALALAIEANLPVISPLNTQPILVESDSPFKRFRLPRATSNVPPESRTASQTESQTENQTASQINRSQRSVAERRSPVRQRQTKTKYWSRTIMSDRQHLMALAQLANQQGWHRLATVVPDTPRGHYLEELVSDTTVPWGETITNPEQPVRYTLTSIPVEPSGLSDATIVLSPDPASNLTSEGLDPPELTPPELELELAPSQLTPSQLATPSNTSEAPDSDSFLASTTVQKTIETTTEVTLDPSILLTDRPDAIVLFIEPDRPPEVFQSVLNQLKQEAGLSELPIVLGSWVDIDGLSAQAPDSAQFLNGLWGLAPSSAPQSRRQLEQVWRKNINPESTLRLAPAVAHAWDAAILMMLAAESAGYNHRYGVQSELKKVANPPGIDVTDVCEGLEHIRQGQSVNYQGVSGRVDLDGWGNVSAGQTYDIWQITSTGERQVVETLQWSEP